MSQVTDFALPTSGIVSGLSYTQELNLVLDALVTNSKGTSAPSGPGAGWFWLDASATPWLFKVYDGASWLTLGSINASTHVWTPFWNGAALAAATTGAAGVVILASNTETQLGTDAAKVLTPDAAASIWEAGADIASASSIAIGDGGFFNVTGTTGITAISVTNDHAGRFFTLVFAGILTITHHATNLILPTAANITTAAGDRASFRSTGSGHVNCIHYTRASGQALSAPASVVAATQAEMEATASSAVFASPLRMQFHPGVAKAWVKIDGTTGAVVASYNTTSVSRTAQGLYTWTIATDFSSANFVIIGISFVDSGNVNKGMYITVTAQAAGVVSIMTRNNGDSLQDPDFVYLAALGDQ